MGNNPSRDGGDSIECSVGARVLSVYPGSGKRESGGQGLRPQASPSPSWASVFLSTVSIPEVQMHAGACSPVRARSALPILHRTQQLGLAQGSTAEPGWEYRPI